MKKTGILSKRYAKALFDLALEMNVLEQVIHDMQLVFDVYYENKDFRLVLDAPIVNQDRKVAIFRRLFKDKVHDVSYKFFMIILRKKREHYLGTIAKQYIALYKKYKKIVTVHLQTAVPIDEKIRKKVIKLLEDQTHGEIDLDEQVKEEIIGGFILAYDDNKYDDSIRAQLQMIKREVADINLYIRGF
jgi:F-type H+-transporting ATPase subunit delta